MLSWTRVPYLCTSPGQFTHIWRLLRPNSSVIFDRINSQCPDSTLKPSGHLFT